jgi:lipoate synthase
VGLRYADVTGVALSDGDVWLNAVPVRAFTRLNPSTGVQQLIPYSSAGLRAPDVFESRPEVLARNVETAGSQGKLQARAMRRLTDRGRPRR